MIHVLYITNDSSLNGANLSLINFLDALSSNNEIAPIVLLPHRGPFINLLQEHRIPFFCFPYRTFVTQAPKSIKEHFLYFLKIIYASINVFAIVYLINIIHKKKIQIIHTNVSVLNIGLIAARICKVPHVWSIREMQIGMKPFCSRKKMIHNFISSDQILCSSQSIADYYGLHTKNTKVLWDIVEKKDEPEKKPETIPYHFFLACGAISPVKGFDIALQGFAFFRKKYSQYSNYKLLIAGDFIRGQKSYSNILYKIIRENFLAESVIFIGYKKNIQYYMKKAKAFIMSSRNEGLGRVTIEAMLNSCPVVGFCSGGTVELLKNGENGFLFSKPEDLADCLNNVINNQFETQKKVNNAKRFSERAFSKEKYVLEAVNIYQKLTDIVTDSSL